MNEFQGLNVPLITIEQFLENGTGAVECDNIQGGCLAAEHLIAQGCRHLIHISGVHETAMPADERAAGFCEVCEQKNVQYQVVGTHAYEYKHLEYHEVLEQLLLQHPDTAGIFASSGLIAAQLLQWNCLCAQGRDRWFRAAPHFRCRWESEERQKGRRRGKTLRPQR